MSGDLIPSLKQKLGCWANERWRTELVLRTPRLASRLGLQWQDLCNRHEKLEIDSATGARICCWKGSSPLTVSRFFPQTGHRLLRHCLQRWPVRFNFGGEIVTSSKPDISVIMPIGGEERLPLFWLSLAALRAQRAVRFEVVVVEQSCNPVLHKTLPRDVRYRHLALPKQSTPFNKSWAFNSGVKIAQSGVLLLLDADYVLPQEFLQEVLLDMQNRSAMRPARIIFYLNEVTTRSALSDRTLSERCMVDVNVQNNPTPISLTRAEYWNIGGHDERYIGWGGEDEEFLDRLRLGNILDGGRLPVIHLWHAPAPQRADGSRNHELHAGIMRVPARERVSSLRQLAFEAGYAIAR